MRRVCEAPDGGEAQVGDGHAHTPCRASAGSNGRAEPDGIDRTRALVVREPSLVLRGLLEFFDHPIRADLEAPRLFFDIGCLH